jgi:hypothetical protein
VLGTHNNKKNNKINSWNDVIKLIFLLILFIYVNVTKYMYLMLCPSNTSSKIRYGEKNESLLGGGCKCGSSFSHFKHKKYIDKELFYL